MTHSSPAVRRDRVVPTRVVTPRLAPVHDLLTIGSCQHLLVDAVVAQHPDSGEHAEPVVQEAPRSILSIGENAWPWQTLGRFVERVGKVCELLVAPVRVGRDELAAAASFALV